MIPKTKNPWSVAALLAWLDSTKKLRNALSISVLNQSVSSSTSLVTMLYLVRVLTPSEFGVYSIGIALSLSYYGIGNALFLTQMVVHSPDKRPVERLNYAARMLVLVGIFCAATVLVAGLVGYLGQFLWAAVGEHAWFALSITAAAVSFLLKDFFARHFYNIRKESHALAVNVTMAICQALLLLALHVLDYSFEAEVALAVYALSHGVAAIFGFMIARLPLREGLGAGLRGDLDEAWRHGKWAIAQNLVYWLRTQAHTYISMIFAGPAGVGLINAARLLISPILFLIPAVSQIMLPRLASVSANKRLALRIASTSAGIFLAMSLTYSAILLINFKYIARLALTPNYADIPSVFLLGAIWCAVMCVQVVQTSFSSLLQALKMFRAWAYENLVAAVAAIIAATACGATIGIPGAVLGAFIGELTLLVLISRHLRKIDSAALDRTGK